MIQTHSISPHLCFLSLLVFGGLLMLPVRAQNSVPASVLHSAQPANTVQTPTVSALQVFTSPSGSAPSLVAQNSEWAVFSSLVNQISCVATNETEVWLGTNFGVKMLNRRTASVRHFTSAEGLPATRIAAIAAERDGVWCIAQAAQPHSADAHLCRYDRAQGRWQRLGSLPYAALSPYSAGNVTVTPLETAFIASTPDFVVFARSPIAAGTRAPFVLWDKRRSRLVEVEWPLELRQAAPFFNVSFMVAERDSLWLGGNAGLLRFEPRRNRWQRFLPARNILAGGREASGDFWLATMLLDATRPVSEPAREARGGFVVEPQPWMLTRYTPHSGRVRDFAAPTSSVATSQGDFERPGASLPLGVNVADGKVWVTTWPRERGSQSRAGFYRLDVETAGWIGLTPQRPQDFDIVPDVVLLQPVRQSPPRPFQMLLMALTSQRFPVWLCPPAPVPSEITNSGPWRFSQKIEEGDIVWSVRGGNVLVRAERGGREETFPLPPPEAFERIAPLPNTANADGTPELPDGFVTPSRNEFGRDVQLIADAAAIWAWRQGRSAQRLFIARFDRVTRQWSVRSDQGLPERKFVSQMWSDGDSLWVNRGDSVYHLEPAAGRWTNPLARLPLDARIHSFRVVDVLPDGPNVWLLTGGLSGWMGAGNVPRLPLLVRYSKATGALEPFSPDGVTPLNGASLLRLRDALLVTTSGGVFRFEPGVPRWQRMDVMPGFALLAELGPARAVRAEGAIWFVCRDGLVRWTGSER